ncbi:MAG: ribosome biogenesis GTP-binding protein YihA/YsxC [Bacilli bacterium]|nr:ribosome biogenesis GTP-binding protein YihA/YsxC [Bacilli bacterium]
MINFQNVIFIKSAPTYFEAPKDSVLDEILIVGRSNVGKSSLINALANHKSLAFTSSKPGHTKLLNFFNVDQKFYLIDAPGYGYSISPKKEIVDFQTMMNSLFMTSKKLKGVIFLLDSRRIPNEDDLLLHDFFLKSELPFILVLTKSDKVNQKEKAATLRELKNHSLIEEEKDLIAVSIKNKKSLGKLKMWIEKILA